MAMLWRPLFFFRRRLRPDLMRFLLAANRQVSACAVAIPPPAAALHQRETPKFFNGSGMRKDK